MHERRVSIRSCWLQKEMIHDVVVVNATSIGQKAGTENDNGCLTVVSLVTTMWEYLGGEEERTDVSINMSSVYILK